MRENIYIYSIYSHQGTPPGHNKYPCYPPPPYFTNNYRLSSINRLIHIGTWGKGASKNISAGALKRDSTVYMIMIETAIINIVTCYASNNSITMAKLYISKDDGQYCIQMIISIYNISNIVSIQAQSQQKTYMCI